MGRTWLDEAHLEVPADSIDASTIKPHSPPRSSSFTGEWAPPENGQRPRRPPVRPPMTRRPSYARCSWRTPPRFPWYSRPPWSSTSSRSWPGRAPPLAASSPRRRSPHSSPPATSRPLLCSTVSSDSWRATPS